MSAAGAVDHGQLVELSEKAFAKLPTTSVTAKELVAQARPRRMCSRTIPEAFDYQGALPSWRERRPGATRLPTPASSAVPAGAPGRCSPSVARLTAVHWICSCYQQAPTAGHKALDKQECSRAIASHLPQHERGKASGIGRSWRRRQGG